MRLQRRLATTNWVNDPVGHDLDCIVHPVYELDKMLETLKPFIQICLFFA